MEIKWEFVFHKNDILKITGEHEGIKSCRLVDLYEAKLANVDIISMAMDSIKRDLQP